MDMLGALAHRELALGVSIEVRDECAAARLHLLDRAAAFAVSPSENRLRDLNTAWWRAKRALDAPMTGGR
jgi:hypothetical protein